MKDKDIKSLYLALGSIMLILLQTTVFQNALGFTNIIGIPYFGDISFFIAKILSFIGIIIFTYVAIKLIFNNLKI